jgi:hypothetical protein
MHRHAAHRRVSGVDGRHVGLRARGFFVRSPRLDLDRISTGPAHARGMTYWTHEELAAVVAAAHADSLVAEVEAYLAAVALFDAEGLSPFAAARGRAALEREPGAR